MTPMLEAIPAECLEGVCNHYMPLSTSPIFYSPIPIDTLEFIIIGVAPDSIVLVFQRSPHSISSLIYLARVYKDPLLYVNTQF